VKNGDAVVSSSWPDNNQTAHNDTDKNTGFANWGPSGASDCDIVTSTNKKTIVDQPRNFTVSPLSSTSVKLSWTDSIAESGYQISYHYLDNVMSACVPGSEFVSQKTPLSLVLNFTCGVTYNFSIVALSPAGKSEETKATPFTVPCSPTIESETPLAETSTTVVRPIDPNDKLHTEGEGEQHLVPVEDRINYTVRFENMAAATAPVQELIVVDYLDPNLDWSTLQFSEIAYGSKILTLPRGVIQYSVRDYPNPEDISGTTEGQLAIDISVSFNPQTGRIEWRMYAVDTATEEPPEDPFSGFLPPEDGTGRGMGFLSFSLRPKPDLPVGTVLENFADIIFDTNEPIRTNTVFNTIHDFGPGPDPDPDGYEIYLPLIVR
jgi:hypothetical protein